MITDFIFTKSNIKNNIQRDPLKSNKFRRISLFIDVGSKVRFVTCFFCIGDHRRDDTFLALHSGTYNDKMMYYKEYSSLESAEKAFRHDLWRIKYTAKYYVYSSHYYRYKKIIEEFAKCNIYF